MIEVFIEDADGNKRRSQAINSAVNFIQSLVEDTGNPNDAMAGAIAGLVFLAHRYHGDHELDDFIELIANAFAISARKARFQFIPSEGGNT